MGGSFLLTGKSLLLAVNWLGLFYLRLKFGLVFSLTVEMRIVFFSLTVELRFGLFCLRWKLGLVLIFAYGSAFPEIRFVFLLTVPRPEIGSGLFCLRFPNRK